MKLTKIWSWIGCHTKDLLWSLVVALLLFIIGTLITRQYNDKKTQASNIISLTDSVTYWKTKSGKVISEKTLLETDFATLKQINDSLYAKLKEMKVSDPIVVIDGKGTITNTQHDTMWMVKIDSTSRYTYRDFDFSDKWRTLSGNVWHEKDTIGLNIEKDIVKFDYTLAVENSKVIMSSTNPYVKFNSVTGLVVPSFKQKQKKFGIGPTIYGGYDFRNKGFGYGIGIGVQYNVLSW